MAELKELPRREWATSEEVVKILEPLLDSARKGMIVSIAYVAERRDDTYESGSTRIHNVFASAGYLFSMGMRLMGFDAARNREPLNK